MGPGVDVAQALYRPLTECQTPAVAREVGT
jgi:hypothetical protein